MSFRLYNTLSRKIEDFVPINPGNVGFYTCGQTVYDFTHIGHLRKYTNDDFLRRTLTYNGFKVQHVQNVTDVGHLTSDADSGEDKLEKGAAREGKSVWEVAKFYERHFYDSLERMNVLKPDVICRATEHIDSQIKMIKELEIKGYTYQSPEAVYFNVSKFSEYGKLSGQNLGDKLTGARDDVVVDNNKKNPADFVLWFKRVGQYKEHMMHWESPWGDGFPGWHIECSAMSTEFLGSHFDIHTGGVDHIPVHHENEIAQSEAALGVKFVNYWVHYEFLLVDGTKMSKSLRNFYTLEDIEKRGFSAMDLRYMFLTTHYRQHQNFTWESLEAAKNARERVINLTGLLKLNKNNKSVEEPSNKVLNSFVEAVNDDLNMPKALAVLWEALKAGVSRETVYKMDEIFGLKLKESVKAFEKEVLSTQVPPEILELAKKRDALREQKDFKAADEVRKEIEERGYSVVDTQDGIRILK